MINTVRIIGGVIRKKFSTMDRFLARNRCNRMQNIIKKENSIFSFRIRYNAFSSIFNLDFILFYLDKSRIYAILPFIPK